MAENDCSASTDQTPEVNYIDEATSTNDDQNRSPRSENYNTASTDRIVNGEVENRDVDSSTSTESDHESCCEERQSENRSDADSNRSVRSNQQTAMMDGFRFVRHGRFPDNWYVEYIRNNQCHRLDFNNLHPDLQTYFIFSLSDNETTFRFSTIPHWLLQAFTNAAVLEGRQNDRNQEEADNSENRSSTPLNCSNATGTRNQDCSDTLLQSRDPGCSQDPHLTTSSAPEESEESTGQTEATVEQISAAVSPLIQLETVIRVLDETVSACETILSLSENIAIPSAAESSSDVSESEQGVPNQESHDSASQEATKHNPVYCLVNSVNEENLDDESELSQLSSFSEDRNNSTGRDSSSSVPDLVDC